MLASSPLLQFLKWENETPDGIFLRQPFNGQWKTWTWSEAGIECRKMANVFHTAGLFAGSHIAILSKNCAHWIMADIAIMMAGCISVPIYPSLSAASIKPILLQSDTKAIIIGKLDNYDEQKNGLPAGILPIGISLYGINENLTWEKSMESVAPIKNVFNWQSDDVMTIIYTSGTTGQPKGVMHTVSGIDAVLKMVIDQMKFTLHFDLFSYLPLSHIAERLAVEMNGIYNGCTISFAESISSFADNLAATQPHFFLAVPHIWSKFRQNILKKIPQKKLNVLLAIPIVNSLVKKSIKKKLGLLRATTILSGAAPISIELQEWFQQLGIKILVAYGMTEDCVYNHIERPGVSRFGSVGKPLPGLLTKIDANGELKVKSISNMVGYYNQPELTAEAFDEEGYLKTGDMGEYDVDGFLYITGRVKDQFKTDKGKYISPGLIEIELMYNTDIELVCIVGMGIPQPIALVNLSETGKLKSLVEIIDSLSSTLSTVNLNLENFERIEKAIIIKDNWSIENGFMTPSLKIKRNEVEKQLCTFYNSWFHQSGKVLRQ